MVDLLIGLAYLAIIASPAIVASVQQAKTHEGNL